MRIDLRILSLLFLFADPVVGSNSDCTKALSSYSSSQVSKAQKAVYFLVGAPNAGKGTAGKPFAKTLGLPYVSTGDILRGIIASGSELGQKIAPIIASGKNIPTEDLKPILAEWISAQNPHLGFVMDGSPRKLVEAITLEEILSKAGYQDIRAVYFKVSNETIHKRAAGRIICSSKSCGQSFHREFVPPLNSHQCDLCQSPLVRRSDDQSIEVVSNRTLTFETDTWPVLNYFRAKGLLSEINAEQSPSRVLADLFALTIDQQN